jgi:hypothetical protein
MQGQLGHTLKSDNIYQLLMLLYLKFSFQGFDYLQIVEQKLEV